MRIKQENAKAEVLKLVKKLDQREEISQSQRVFEPNLNLETAQTPLHKLRAELEDLYKNLLLSIHTTEKKVVIKTRDFGIFEKRLNSILMQVHEASERSHPISRRKTQVVTKSLFSCMNATEGDALRTIKKRRSRQL